MTLIPEYKNNENHQHKNTETIPKPTTPETSKPTTTKTQKNTPTKDMVKPAQLRKVKSGFPKNHLLFHPN